MRPGVGIGVGIGVLSVLVLVLMLVLVLTSVLLCGLFGVDIGLVVLLKMTSPEHFSY